ncbi:hypothetical protein KIPB_014592 [Kipferlia bialata]|uniref:RNA polymerase Rpb5 N-terminal domain-containing protein n=1 Tax=Kipferlia bialata TaxID=797122 RepID=A0A9K3D8Z4_9EUKA|nr:hypothetical protein KIPB_014592 [Kipferlia bialata]|eukprot:g14592.t1
MDNRKKMEKLFRIRKTVCEMLMDRGYIVDEVILSETLEQFVERGMPRDKMDIFGISEVGSDQSNIRVNFFKVCESIHQVYCSV